VFLALTGKHAEEDGPEIGAPAASDRRREL